MGKFYDYEETLAVLDRQEIVTMEKFFMLFVDGRNQPTHKHSTRENAQNEAARLISKDATARIYILEAIAVVQSEVPPVTVTDLK